MQLPYTVKAKKAIDIAGKMSKSLHHNYIGTEHLLIGLLKENSGVAAKILNENGVELDKIVDLIKELIAPAEGTAVAESDGYSPRAAKVLENAEKEAVRFHADAIGTEHILIAMIKETSLAGTFMLYELMFTRVLLANKFLMWQPLFIISGMYLAMTLVLTALVSLLEKRFSERD